MTMKRKHIIFLLFLALIGLVGGISVAQKAPEKLQGPIEEPKAAKITSPRAQGQKAPRVVPFDPEIPVRELDLVGRLHLSLPTGTRWEVERPLDEGHFFLTLSPRPKDLEKQLEPLSAQTEVKISLERDSPELAVIRVEQREQQHGPLLVWAGPLEPVELDRLSRFYEPRGAIEGAEKEKEGPLFVHFGRAARMTPQQELCRLLRQPYPPFMPEGYEGRQKFLQAEEAFALENYREAMALYREIAEPMSGTPELDYERRRTKAWRQILAAEEEEAKRKAEEAKKRKEAGEEMAQEAPAEAPAEGGEAAPAEGEQVAGAQEGQAPAEDGQAAPKEGEEVAEVDPLKAPMPTGSVLEQPQKSIDDMLFEEALEKPEVLKTLAALRMGDIMVCAGRPRAAHLRYQLLEKGSGAGVTRRLARYQATQVAYPEVVLTPVLEDIAMLEEPKAKEEAGALMGLLRVHAARVLMQAERPREGLEMLLRVTEEERSHMDPEYLALMEERSLGDAVNMMMRQGDDVGLAALVTQHHEVASRHRRYASIARVTGEALLHLMLPERAIPFLQKTMAELPPEVDQLALLSLLASSYRDAGDIYRADRTLRYLVEQLESADHWLRRRDEVSISLTAASIHLDRLQWGQARGWLARAWKLGAGDKAEAMLAYAHGRELMSAGDRKGATGALLHAARNRKHIPPRRRAEVCLLTAQILEDFGKRAEAEDLLRRFMAETTHETSELEVAWRLAQLMEKRGEFEKAQGLYAEIALRKPSSSYSKIARYRSEEVEFLRQHAEALTTLEVLRVQD